MIYQSRTEQIARSGCPPMKPSLWFEVSMLALILIVSVISVAAQESDRERLASDEDKTALLSNPSELPHYQSVFVS